MNENSKKIIREKIKNLKNLQKLGGKNMFFILSVFGEKIFLTNEKRAQKLAKKSKCKVLKFVKYDEAKEYLLRNYEEKNDKNISKIN